MRHLFLSTALATVALVGFPAALKAADTSTQASAQTGASGGQAQGGAQMQSPAMSMETLRSNLEAAGFSNIEIVDAAYLVRAETEDGERVVMFLDPPRTTASAGEAGSGQQQPQDETQQAAQQGGEMGQAGATGELGDRYRSFEQANMDREQWVVGDLTAEDLLDKEVVDPSGEVIGTSSDLLVDETDRVRAVLVDMEDGSHLAIAVDRLELEQGGGGQLVSDIGPTEIEAQPRYQLEELEWYRTAY